MHIYWRSNGTHALDKPVSGRRTSQVVNPARSAYLGHALLAANPCSAPDRNQPPLR
jgi:hypothetical protein